LNEENIKATIFLSYCQFSFLGWWRFIRKKN